LMIFAQTSKRQEKFVVPTTDETRAVSVKWKDCQP